MILEIRDQFDTDRDAVTVDATRFEHTMLAWDTGGYSWTARDRQRIKELHEQLNAGQVPPEREFTFLAIRVTEVADDHEAAEASH